MSQDARLARLTRVERRPLMEAILPARCGETAERYDSYLRILSSC